MPVAAISFTPARLPEVRPPGYGLLEYGQPITDKDSTTGRPGL